MRRAFRVLATLAFLIGLACSTRAQVPMTGAGLAKPTAAAGYTGPGDIVSNAKAWWGLRAYSSATRGNKAANVCNVADAVCADLLTDATTGALVITTIGGSSCAIVTCTVKTMYDQTGNTNCLSAACDITQATIANRPTLVVSCTGGLPCLGWTTSQSLVSANNLTTDIAQPFSVSAVGERTGSTSSFADLTSAAATGTVQLGFANATNKALIFAGSVVGTVTANDNAFHAFNALFNGASSSLMVDGSLTSSLNPGANAAPGSAPLCMGSCNNGLAGNSMEAGWWAGDKSATFTTLDSNERTYWGF